MVYVGVGAGSPSAGRSARNNWRGVRPRCCAEGTKCELLRVWIAVAAPVVPVALARQFNLFFYACGGLCYGLRARYRAPSAPGMLGPDRKTPVCAPAAPRPGVLPGIIGVALGHGVVPKAQSVNC